MEEPTVAALEFGGGAPEYRVLASRDTRNEVLEWVHEVQRLAWREGGNLDWRTRPLRPGGIPGMTGPGIGKWAAHTLRCQDAP
eukprot:75090-Lingulodinium_polyedra.AAC.1